VLKSAAVPGLNSKASPPRGCVRRPNGWIAVLQQFSAAPQLAVLCHSCWHPYGMASAGWSFRAVLVSLPEFTKLLVQSSETPLILLSRLRSLLL